MLSEWWRDFIALTGLAVTVVGFAFTLYQLYKTKSAADAARTAAERAFAQSQGEFRRLLASSGHALASNLRVLVERKQWGPASGRANDLADQLTLIPGAEPGIMQIVQEIRVWGLHFARLEAGELKRFNNVKWAEVLLLAQRTIDNLRTATTVPPRGAE